MSGSGRAGWGVWEMPDLAGRSAVVTGATGGVGFHTALELARHGAEVTLACRPAGRGALAAARIREAAPKATVRLAELDLADLDSVRAFADHHIADHDRLDLLVNGAGVMASPRRRSADGFELRFGVNHLGHFALTGRLLPLLLARPGARVVTVTSLAAWYGRLRFADLQRERGHSRWLAYGQAKFANLMFAVELQRRAEEAGAELISVAAHPGYASSAPSLGEGAPGGDRPRPRALRVGDALLAQSAADGALPVLCAATAPGVTGGALYGPGGLGHLRGRPRPAPIRRRAAERASARRLWQRSEELTGVRYELAAGVLP